MEISRSARLFTQSRTWGYFALHLLAVYALALAISPLLLGFFYRHIATQIEQGTSIPELQYYFAHLFLATFVPAIAAGYLNFRYRHAAALWIWLVPTAILVYKLLTLQPPSVFNGRWSGVFAYFFSSDWSVPTSAQEAFSSNLQGMRVYIAQTNYSAPFYAGAAYSIGAFARKHWTAKRA